MERRFIRWVPRAHAAGGASAVSRSPYAYSAVVYRAELARAVSRTARTVPVTLDRPLVLKALALFGAAVIAWLGGGSLPLVAITAGAVMVAVAQRDPAYCDRPRRMVAAPVLRFVVRRHAAVSNRPAQSPGSTIRRCEWCRAARPGARRWSSVA